MPVWTLRTYSALGSRPPDAGFAIPLPHDSHTTFLKLEELQAVKCNLRDACFKGEKCLDRIEVL